MARGPTAPLLSLLLPLAGCVAAPGDDPDPPTPAPTEEPTPNQFDPFAGLLLERLPEAVLGEGLEWESSLGVAFADVDNDGLTDVMVTSHSKTRLYRNLGDFNFEPQDNSLWQFDAPAPPSDPPPGARGGDPPPPGGNMGSVWGAVFADYDNDGDQDLFLLDTNANRLLRNDGDWQWTEVTDETGWTGASSTYSAALDDIDGDGWLDVYFTNHLRIGQGGGPLEPPNGARGGDPPPGGDPPDGDPPAGGALPAPDQFYRARGDGSFEDVVDLLPAELLDGTGWTALWSDLDLDGDRDLYQGNEIPGGGGQQPNHLFRNDGMLDGLPVFSLADEDCFCDVRLAPMGVTAGDYDRDGLQDLFMTNTYLGTGGIEGETTGSGEIMLRNMGGLLFLDTSLTSGANLGALEEDRRTVSWGTDFADIDNDGWLDLYVAYGPFVEDLFSPQPNGLLLNVDGSFLIHEGSGASSEEDTRGLAFADLDGDGCLDLVEAHRNGPPGVYRNTCASGNHWLQLDLVGTTSNRDAIGSIVRVSTEDGELTEELIIGAVHSSPWKTMHFGLGRWPAAARVEITWPDGTVEARSDVQGDRRITATQGSWAQ